MLQKSVLGEQIAAIVRERIVSGTLAAGDRLVERTLADEFGTSQGPVRDALAQLEGQGLVVSKPHCGTHVRDIVEQELAETMHLRGLLLADAVRRSCGPDLGDFEAAIASFEAAQTAHEAAVAFSAFERATAGLGGSVFSRLWESLSGSVGCRIVSAFAHPSVRTEGLRYCRASHRELTAGRIEACVTLTLERTEWLSGVLTAGQLT